MNNSMFVEATVADALTIIGLAAQDMGHDIQRASILTA